MTMGRNITMAEIVLIPPIIRQKFHRVVLGKIFWVGSDVFFKCANEGVKVYGRRNSPPLTASHKVAMVGLHSSRAMVKPETNMTDILKNDVQ